MGDVTVALNEHRSIVRTWLMRGTLHLVAADDLRWMVRVLGPLFAGGNRARHAKLGLDTDLKARGVESIRRILGRSGPLTRYEIVDRLHRQGINLDPKSQAQIHLMAVAAFSGAVCLGPDRANGEPTYVLIDDWIDPRQSTSPKDPLGELARRYFAAYGPATLEDLAAWSGLPMVLARSAVTAAHRWLMETTIGGRSAYLPKTRAARRRQPSTATPSVRLLPAFDTYLLGYRSRDLAVPASLQRRLQRGGGWLHPAVVVDGRAVAAWSLKKTGSGGQVTIEPLEPIPQPVQTGIDAEVADVGRFLGLPLTLGRG